VNEAFHPGVGFAGGEVPGLGVHHQGEGGCLELLIRGIRTPRRDPDLRGDPRLRELHPRIQGPGEIVGNDKEPDHVFIL